MQEKMSTLTTGLTRRTHLNPPASLSRPLLAMALLGLVPWMAGCNAVSNDDCDLRSVLAEAAPPEQDALDPTILGDQAKVNADSARLLYEDADARYYIAESNADELCLAIAVGDSGAATCSTALDQGGYSVSLGPRSATIIGNNTTIDTLEEQGYVQVTECLAISE